MQILDRTLDWFRGLVEQYPDEREHFGHFPSMFGSLVSQEGRWEHYDGPLRFTDADGSMVADQVAHRDYAEHIGEAVEDFSYLKFPYYKPRGYPDGLYRVGPLARLNNCQSMGTPRADEALAEFRQRFGHPSLSSFDFHWARIVEMVAAVEGIEALLDDPDILDPYVRARARPNREEGVGVSEAPRGTLIHHYRIDRRTGQMRWANLIIATGHNNLAMNRSVRQVAERYVKGNELSEGMLNRVEAVIRTYDPCLSCSTHAAGQMPLWLELVAPDGQVVDRLRRD
jgi:NAD-reducing hydrogenase large subunit